MFLKNIFLTDWHFSFNTMKKPSRRLPTSTVRKAESAITCMAVPLQVCLFLLDPNFLSRFSAVWLCYAWVCSSLYLSYLGCTVLLISVTNIFTKLGNFQLLFLHIVFARFSLLLELQLHVIRKLGINLMYVRLLNVDFFFSNLFFFRLGDVYTCLQVSRSCLL